MNKPDEESWSILRLIEWTARYLEEKGSESPRLDAEVLLADVRKCSRIELYTAFDEVADSETRTAYKALIQRRANGEPVAYLVGYKEFYSRDFKVTPAVLIPRPETEFVVIAAIDYAAEQGWSGDLRIADIGTGSGVLAITLAKERSGWNVVATDIQPDALRVADENVRALGVTSQVELRNGDFFAGETEPDQFDIVVSNPPYVTRKEYDNLSDTVRKYEPEVALVGGEHGTEIIEQLLEESTSRVRGAGAVIIEISPMIETAVTGLVERHRAWRLHQVKKDHAGLSRVVVAVRK
ncbi:MAG: peptide chain release factor N(5)-glutamine methyltransferase [Planctomycetota bacterium]|nr:peptide chain release factor N(5)-glutamine methyltransferase [Planctomycetota bacterium]